MSNFVAVRHLFPNAVVFRDWEIRDEVITRWDAVAMGGPQPNQSVLDQAKIDAATAAATAATQLANERAMLIALRDKVQGGQDLTAGEMRAVIRLLIRRSLLRD